MTLVKYLFEYELFSNNLLYSLCACGNVLRLHSENSFTVFIAYQSDLWQTPSIRYQTSLNWTATPLIRLVLCAEIMSHIPAPNSSCKCKICFLHICTPPLWVLFTFDLAQEEFTKPLLSLCPSFLYPLPLCFYLFSGVRASLQVREVSSEGEVRAQKGQRRWVM